MICALSDKDCRGRIEMHHIVSKNRLKQEFRFGASKVDGVYRGVDRWEQHPDRLLPQILRDKRNLLPICAFHHEATTNHRVYPPIPKAAWAFARAYGMEAHLERYEERAA